MFLREGIWPCNEAPGLCQEPSGLCHEAPGLCNDRARKATQPGMRVHVLGSAAGGGFPQWNCNCRNCSGLRPGRINARARTQSSIAVSADGGNWVLFNASPDILAQLCSFPKLQPARAIRDTAIVAVVLVD